MEEQTKELKDYIYALRRRRTLILSVTLGFFVIFVLAAFLWPPVYRSTATVLIEEQEVPPELIRSTVTSYAAQRIQTINQRVMTRANLMQIIEKYDLYHDKRRTDTTEEILTRMRKDVRVEMINADVLDPRTGAPRPATIAFTLAYDGESPEMTQKVTSEVTSLYLNENLKNRTEKASETYTFLSNEADKLRDHIVELESQIAAFKEKNAGRLPELTAFNMQSIDRVQRDLLDLENQMRSLDERRFYLEGQLAQINPLSFMVGEGGEQASDPVTQLKMLRMQYISATSKYSLGHPDVVRLRRQIEGLEKQTGDVNSSTEQAKELATLRTELAANREKYSADHPDVIRLAKAVAAQEAALKPKPTPESEPAKVKPDNPAYLTFQAQLDGIKSQLKSIPPQRDALKVKLAQYEKYLRETPEVERQYSVILRDYETSSRRYFETKAKLNEASVGQELEKERKAEKFVLIDPPQLPEKPVIPNRPAIVILGFLLSISGGVGSALMLDVMDKSIRGVRGLAAVLQSPPLSVIPYVPNCEDIARHKKTKKLVIVTASGSFALILLLIHLFWTPLDVLWFKGLRKVDTAIGS
jgi:succinoglycan biosynthesis transport protein ExoP